MNQFTTSAAVIESHGRWRSFCSLPHVQYEATSYLDGKMNLYCSPVKHCETNLQQLNHVKECQNSWLFCLFVFLNHILHTVFGTYFYNRHFVSVSIAAGNSGNFVFQQGVNAPHCITRSNLPECFPQTWIWCLSQCCPASENVVIRLLNIIPYSLWCIREEPNFCIIHVMKHWVNTRIRYYSNATKKLRCYELWDWCAPCDMKHILNIII